MSTKEEQENPLIGTLLNDRYLLQSQLGGGGMGAVYLAQDQEVNEQVALKLVVSPKEALTSTFEKRMLREIKVLMLAEDPRVIALLDWGRDPKHGLYYTMEKLDDAVSMKDHLATHDPPFWERIRLLREVLCGLNAMHEIKAVHRDIKPANILCIGNPSAPEVKLIDPGIAKWFHDDLRTQITVETEAGGFVGTPAYTAPEMWQGLTLDARTDIYQCGIMGFELMTGGLPFQGTLYNVMFKHIQQSLPSIVPRALQRWRTLPPEVLNATDSCIKRAAAKEPEERFASAREFITALDLLHSSNPNDLDSLSFTPARDAHDELASAETLDAALPTGERPPRQPAPTATFLPAESTPPPKALYWWIGLVALCCIGALAGLVIRTQQSSTTQQAKDTTPRLTRPTLRPKVVQKTTTTPIVRTTKKKATTRRPTPPRARTKRTPRLRRRPIRRRIRRPTGLDTTLPL